MLVKVANYYKLEKLSECKGLKHGFSTKFYGNMSTSYGDIGAVSANRQKFAKQLGAEGSPFLTFDLVKSGVVKTITEKNFTYKKVTETEPFLAKTDAAITNLRNVFFLLNTGDCLPVIYYDPVSCVCGIAHAGWQGLVSGIHTKVVYRMVAEFGSLIKNIKVGIGPSIISCCNVQKPPLAQENLFDWTNYIKKESNGNFRVYLVEYCKDNLLDAGILEENIEAAEHCVVDNCKEFFSETAVHNGCDKDVMGRFCTIVGMV